MIERKIHLRVGPWCRVCLVREVEVVMARRVGLEEGCERASMKMYAGVLFGVLV